MIKILQSAYGSQSTSFERSCTMNGEQQREIQLLIHSFIRKENAPFWSEDHLRILDHLCGWLKLKKKPEFSKDKQEFNNRRAMHVKKKFWRENTM